MKKTLQKKISMATHENIPDILKLLEQNLFSYRKLTSLEMLENEGFIYYTFSNHELKVWLNDLGYILLVCLENEKLLGYTIGSDLDKLTPQMQANIITLLESSSQFANGFAKHKIFYHKQIVTGQPNEGVGKLLMNELFRQLKERGYDEIICAISERPYPNLKSIAFHQKLGFQQIGSIHDHEVVDGLYLKRL